MNPELVKQSLRALQSGLRAHLDDSATVALPRSIDEVNRTYAAYQLGQRYNPKTEIPWGYAIPREAPLSFRMWNLRGRSVRFDISTEVRWLDPEAAPIKHDLLVRLWSLDMDVMFRRGLDAPEVRDSLAASPSRVMSRFHFDLANPRQAGPRFHMQFGGNPMDHELCWIHPGIDVPRHSVAPMDLILASEMVISCLSSPHDVRLLSSSVAGAIARSQTELLPDYFARAMRAVEAETSVLRAHWNV